MFGEVFDGWGNHHLPSLNSDEERLLGGKLRSYCALQQVLWAPGLPPNDGRL